MTECFPRSQRVERRKQSVAQQDPHSNSFDPSRSILAAIATLTSLAITASVATAISSITATTKAATTKTATVTELRFREFEFFACHFLELGSLVSRQDFHRVGFGFLHHVRRDGGHLAEIEVIRFTHF